MSRTIDAATIAVLGNADLQMFHLVTFEFATAFRLTDHFHDISYDFGLGTETFLSNARLQAISSVDESIDVENPSITITLTGANAADISLPFTESYSDRRVVVRRGFYDTSGQTQDANIIVQPFIIWDGRVDSWGIVDDPTAGESTVSWKINSHWADWEKVAGRKCNNQDAQLYYPTEEGFNFTYAQIGDVLWGRVRT